MVVASELLASGGRREKVEGERERCLALRVGRCGYGEGVAVESHSIEHRVEVSLRVEHSK